MSLGKILAMDLPAQAKLSHYPLLGMRDGIFWSHMTGSTLQLVAGRSLAHLPCFGSQRRSWETISFLLLRQRPCRWCIWRIVKNGGRSPQSSMLDK